MHLSPFTVYSSLDRIVARCSGRYAMPLLGGTALEILAHMYGVAAPRSRSVNDFDFLYIEGVSRPLFQFDAHLQKLGLSRGKAELSDPHIGYTGQDKQGRPVEVDVLQTFEADLANHIVDYKGFCLLSARGQISMKRERLAMPMLGTSAERLALDQADIQWLQSLK